MFFLFCCCFVPFSCKTKQKKPPNFQFFLTLFLNQWRNRTWIKLHTKDLWSNQEIEPGPSSSEASVLTMKETPDILSEIRKKRILWESVEQPDGALTTRWRQFIFTKTSDHKTTQSSRTQNAPGLHEGARIWTKTNRLAQRNIFHTNLAPWDEERLHLWRRDDMKKQNRRRARKRRMWQTLCFFTDLIKNNVENKQKGNLSRASTIKLVC